MDESTRVRLSDTTIELEQPEDLEFSQLERQQKLQLITDLNNQITQMRQRLGNQRIEIEVLRIR